MSPHAPRAQCSSGVFLAPCPPCHTMTPQRVQLSAEGLWGRQAESEGPGARSLWTIWGIWPGLPTSPTRAALPRGPPIPLPPRRHRPALPPHAGPVCFPSFSTSCLGGLEFRWVFPVLFCLPEETVPVPAP